MDDRLEQLIEMECADALLDGGVSVPLKRWSVPFKKRPLELRVTMKRPRLRGQILLAREYLKLGVAPGWKPKDMAEEMAFVAKYGKGISRMLAYTVCRGCVARRVGIGLTAWILRELVDWRFLVAAFHMFARIIRSVDRANPMKPRLSQVGRGS